MVAEQRSGPMSQIGDPHPVTHGSQTPSFRVSLKDLQEGRHDCRELLLNATQTCTISAPKAFGAKPARHGSAPYVGRHSSNLPKIGARNSMCNWGETRDPA
jgi:hypothetical protein